MRVTKCMTPDQPTKSVVVLVFGTALDRGLIKGGLASGLRLLPRDFAKLDQLVLQPRAAAGVAQ
jgi:hypothetical protein